MLSLVRRRHRADRVSTDLLDEICRLGGDDATRTPSGGARGPRRVAFNATRGALGVTLIALLVAGCTADGGPILANPPAQLLPAPSPTASPSRPADPLPVELPRDDGPHDRLTEWWYFTGHLRSEDDQRFGFEYVIFRAERGTFPTVWASHLAITDETNRTFDYAQRTEIGPQVDRSPRDASGEPTGFDLSLSGIDPSDPSTLGRAPWSMGSGVLGNGAGQLTAVADPSESTVTTGEGRLGIDLAFSPIKPPVLHDKDGWIDFGPAGGSYYYSRTSLRTAGTLALGSDTFRVDGSAWFDHQWGDFITVGGGGWDWFAINLDDGTDVTLSQVRDADGSYPLVYGTIVDPSGTSRHLERDDFTIEATQRWTSPETGATYPAAWHITIGDLVIDLVPTVADQELDTRASTGVVYWEGSQLVSARRTARRMEIELGGEAYVELTGYAPAGLLP
jgi:predicted secreted hydrolase